MKKTQRLSSGLIIRQDFREAVRFIMFETPFEGWEYATHGGTAFLVNYKGKIFGFTCVHVKGDFNWNQLTITNSKFGTHIAGIKAVYTPKNPIKFAIDSDIADIAIIGFTDDCNTSFFQDGSYIIDTRTIATSKKGDSLVVAGNLKTTTKIENYVIAPIFCFLGFTDYGAAKNDIVLRKAVGKYENPDFGDVMGLSGAPVFNQTQNTYCGMVVRGGIKDKICTIWYVDIADIMQVLSAVYEGRENVYYEKIPER